MKYITFVPFILAIDAKNLVHTLIFLRSLVPPKEKVYRRMTSYSDVCEVHTDMQMIFLNVALCRLSAYFYHL